ncbi:alpha/beta fold hydrolase [Cytobacillus sp. IB215665]|uniref:alpha/beta fold hydrolase n=1 Tax=Cytobacillus sp. IB215665 TaxID=3097357 RepID=UPI002A158706|nr:alpha/beta fold hydrolase [Cytobacillus sp. IB215665]MDX8367728.1 alpha/beta fold hydrolase [Cytobacillus sp. IB215665]
MEKAVFVQIGDYKLFAQLFGQKKDKPTIVMESGYGESSKTWDSIIQEVSKLTEVLIYDRAGLGESEKSSNPRTSREMVKELKELINQVKIKPPYILIGHSFGGVNARIYATKYPNEVCGLILIDSTPENYREKFLPTMSKEFQESYNNQFIYEGNYDEFMESLKQLKESKMKLNVPLTVLSAGKKDHYSKKSQELWNGMQREILDISSNSDFINAENSTHYIHKDNPKIVINAIKQMINTF